MGEIFKKALRGYPYAEVEPELSSTYSHKSIERHGRVFESTLRTSFKMSDAQIEEYVEYLLQTDQNLGHLVEYKRLAKDIDEEQPYIPSKKIYRHILFGEVIFSNKGRKLANSIAKDILDLSLIHI